MSKNEINIIKKGYQKDVYTQDRMDELLRCASDPLHFIENYVKVQHPMKGRVPLALYPYQREMIRAFHENRRVVALTARQMGKSCFFATLITKNGLKVTLGQLIKLNPREKLVNFLERLLVKLVTD